MHQNSVICWPPTGQSPNPGPVAGVAVVTIAVGSSQVQCYIPAVAKHRAVNPCFGPQLPLLRLTKKDVPVVGGEAGLLLRGERTSLGDEGDAGDRPS